MFNGNYWWLAVGLVIFGMLFQYLRVMIKETKRREAKENSFDETDDTELMALHGFAAKVNYDLGQYLHTVFTGGDGVNPFMKRKKPNAHNTIFRMGDLTRFTLGRMSPWEVKRFIFVELLTAEEIRENARRQLTTECCDLVIYDPLSNQTRLVCSSDYVTHTELLTLELCTQVTDSLMSSVETVPNFIKVQKAFVRDYHNKT